MKLEHTPFIQKQFSGIDVHSNLSVYTVVKATYDFNNTDELKIADEQEDIVTHDQFYHHPKNSSIQYAEESMPFKKGGELLLIGFMEPRLNDCKQQAFTVKLKHNNTDWQKSLTIFGKRYWYNTLMGAKISEPLPIVEPIELRYEFSFGSHQYPANPCGKGFTDKWLKVDDIELPQIEYSHALIRSPRSRPHVAGFNAIPRHWQPRLHGYHQYSQVFSDMHNVAPLDQQFAKPFQGEEVLFISDPNCRISLPKPPTHRDRALSWDTVILNLNKKKLYLLTRLILKSTQNIIHFE